MVRKTICMKTQRQIMPWPLMFEYDERGIGVLPLPSGQGSAARVVRGATVPVLLVQATKEKD